MARIESWFRQDLKEPVHVQMIHGNVFSQDEQANLIGVTLTDGGEAATLSGTVSASIIRADGATVAQAGTLSGNRCSVILPAAAYAVPGPLVIALKLTQSGVVTTVLAVAATVYRTSTDSVVDPGTIIPSIQDLINDIDAAVASIPADYSSLWASLAPAFSASTSYSAWEYVTYNGKVCRFINNHSGTWSNADVVVVNVGNEIERLRNYTTEYKGVLPATITDCNDIQTNSCYFISMPRDTAVANWPLGEYLPGWIVTYSTVGNPLQLLQIVYPWNDGEPIYYRVCQHGATWHGWYKLTADNFDNAMLMRDQNFGRGASDMLVNTAIDFHVANTDFVCEYDLDKGMYKTTGTLPTSEREEFVNIAYEDHGLCGLVAGKEYNFIVRTDAVSPDSAVPRVQMFFNTTQSGAASWQFQTTIFNDRIFKFKIPNDVSGLLFRWVFSPGTYNTYAAFECVESDSLTPHMASFFKDIVDDYLPSCDLNSLTNGNHFYLLIDSQEYEHMPLSTLRVGFLEVQRSANWGKQFFYSLRESKTWVRTFTGNTFETDWILVGGGNTYNITQEVSQDTFQNTYNITTNPQITTDTNDFLQAVDDETTTEANATDMTGAIMSMLNSTGHCKLGTGTFYVSGNINLPNGATLEGCGDNTIIRLLSSVTSGYIVRLSQYCTVKNIRFSGGKNLPTNLYTDGTNMGSRHGVYMIANADGQETAQPQVLQNIVTECFFENFDGSAFYGHNTGGGLHNSVIFTDSHIEHCRVGVNLDYNCEYGKYSDLVIFQCYYACINNGGNNVFTGCTFHGVVGWLTDNSGNDKPNNQHGSCVGCTFNHIDNMNYPAVLGNGKAVHIINGGAGFIFTGCQLWYGNVYIENSVGVQFSDCLFGNNAIEIEVTGSYPAFFFNNIFWNAPTLNVITSCKFKDNYLRSGTVVEP